MRAVQSRICRLPLFTFASPFPARLLPLRPSPRSYPTFSMSAPTHSQASTSSLATTTAQTRKQQSKQRQPPPSASTTPTTQPPSPSYDYASLRLTDIGANLIDDMYSGLYHSAPKHQPDLPAVLARAAQHGLSAIIVTAGTLDECQQACQLIRRYEASSGPLQLYTTCGIHPTRTKQFAALPADRLQRLFDDMAAFISAHLGDVVAVGECGFDVDRLHFSSFADQRTVFPHHIRLAQRTGLPLFLHDRGATPELLPLLAAASPGVRGVVHSYTGGRAEMLEYVRYGFYIGVNGCSLKTANGLDTVAAVPADRLLLETDAPWCDVKAAHAGFRHVRSRWDEVKPEKADAAVAAAAATGGSGGGVLVKGRNEPCKLLCVAEVVAAVRGVTVEELAAVVADNTERLFGIGRTRRQPQDARSSGADAADAQR